MRSYELSDIAVYELVKSGAMVYPSGFWDGVPGLTAAKKIVKYVFTDVLKWSINDIKTKATRQVFQDYKLDRMLTVVFDGSMYIALGEIYPELKEWAEKLYQEYDFSEVSSHKRYTEQELIDILQDKTEKLGRIPKANEMRCPSGITFTYRFGSWEKALMRAGLIEDIYKGINMDEYSQEGILWHLKQVAVEKERTLEKNEVFELYPEAVIKECFGSYPVFKRIFENEYTEKELVKILKRKQKELGRIPTNKDIKFPRPIVFVDKFGSWQEAIETMEKA